MHTESGKYSLLFISKTEETERIMILSGSSGFRIKTASTSQEAIQEASVHLPDVLIADTAAFTNPIREIRLLRQNPHTRHIPLLLIVVGHEFPAIQEITEDCSTDFIFHPFRNDELLTRIQNLQIRDKAFSKIQGQKQHLKEMLTAREKLLSVIAHDLRAPIGTIKMINSALENKKDKMIDPQVVRLFRMINETTEEAFDLLENLLRWSRDQNGKAKVSPSAFNLVQTIQQVALLFSAIASAKDICLQNKVSGIMNVYADEDMIKTALRNLISNAVKFTSPGGNVTLSLSETADMAVVSVEDTGMGIPENRQAVLLKKKHPGSAGTMNENGSGLGLFLSRDFIRMNKGKLWFHSIEGQGTTFSFSVPRSPASKH